MTTKKLQEQRRILHDCIKRAHGSVLTHYFANGAVGFVGPGGVAFEQGDFDPPLYTCWPRYSPGMTRALPITVKTVADALVRDSADEIVCTEERAVQYVARRRP